MQRSQPFEFTIHWFDNRATPTAYAIEFYPGDPKTQRHRYTNFYAGVLFAETPVLDAYLSNGLRGDARYACALRLPTKDYQASHGRWWIMRSNLPLTRIQSCFLRCKRLPQFIVAGVVGGEQMRILVATHDGVPTVAPRAPDTLTSSTGISANQSWSIFRFAAD